jgi:hypothetical protein
MHDIFTIATTILVMGTTKLKNVEKDYEGDDNECIIKIHEISSPTPIP